MKELPLFVNNKEINSRRISHQQPMRFARKKNSSSQNATSRRWRGNSAYGQEPNDVEQCRRKAINAILFILLLLYLYTLFRTEEMLEDYRSQGGAGSGLVADINKENNETDDTDEIGKSTIYIIFQKMTFGQGHGNIMAGLLAAHLLGEEFNRVVCVEKDYVDFHAAFELKDPHIRALCETLLVNEPNVKIEDFLQAISFSDTPNECDWKERLSLDTKVIKFEGNTYPRWPKVPHGFFLKFYQPRRALLDILPYTKQPESVVHLRDPDGPWDSRQGVDEASFMELGRMLPSDTYLVTNRVDWYNLFHEKFNWSHPKWSIVRHSISGLAWKAHYAKGDNSVEQHQQGPMQMWADWYTVLMAKHVYHTHSEFSNSAVHWMNIEDSHVLNGINETTMELTFRPEAWIRDGLSPALVDRTSDPTLPLEMQLRACDIHHTPIVQDGVVPVAHVKLARDCLQAGINKSLSVGTMDANQTPDRGAKPYLSLAMDCLGLKMGRTN